MSTKTFSVFKTMFLPLVRELKMEYWSTHCGVDGYLYLLFQRRFLRLTIYMSVISIIAQVSQYMIVKNYNFRVFGEEKHKDQKDIEGVEIFTNVVAKHSSTSDQLTQTQSWIKIFVTFTFTLLTIRIVQKTRRDAKIALESFY